MAKRQPHDSIRRGLIQSIEQAKQMIEIPMSLARLLAADPTDFKDENRAGDVQNMARASLRLLMLADERERK